jgi:hypothetical protein
MRLTAEGLCGTTEELNLPELDGTVLVRGLTRAELRDVRERSGVDTAPSVDKVDGDLMDLLMIVHGLQEPRLLDDGMDAAVEKARTLPAGSAARIVSRVMWLTGLRGWITPNEGAEPVPAGPFPGGTGDDDR